ncbi:TRAP transporter small permease [Roseibium sp. MMSF_3544]|uniref:TRAP transporter small permease n=1 Tax=unclassified Roseibium TaxID=2629323 RepID=UPI00273FAA78|nr:TRAP transporter small permease [Roseibium sp. MMSF_3544]
MNLSSKPPDGVHEGAIGFASRLLAPVEDIANMVAGIAIFVLMVLGVAQIGLRSIFNAPVVGYIDLVELSMATMAFLGAAYCQRLGAHIRMELLISHLHGRLLWLVEIFGLLCGLFILGVLIWYGWDHFLRAYELGDTTIDAEYPVWPSKLLVPVALSFWFVRLLIQLAAAIHMLINPSQYQEGAITSKDVVEVAHEEIEGAFGHGTAEAPGEREGQNR